MIVRRAADASSSAWLMALVVLSLTVSVVEAQNRLVIIQQPSSGTGGTPFPAQPRLMVVDANGHRVPINVALGVTAAVQVNPSGYAIVQGPNFASVNIVNGFANFTGLYINMLGTGYTLRFSSADYWVDSTPFNINLGPPAKLAVVQQPGTATGGVPFRPQPVIELQDAGGNAYTPADGRTQATVSLVANPNNAGRLYEVPTRRPEDRPFWARAVNGRFSFDRLTIDKAAYGYKLRFSTNVHTRWNVTPDYIDTDVFTVGIGPTAYLDILVQPDGAFGGTEFLTQPSVALRDAGGNLNIHDSSSTVTVSLEVAPGFAELAPTYLRTVMNFTGDVTRNSPFVITSENADPRLLEGQLIEIGNPLPHVSGFNALAVYPPPVQIRIVESYRTIRLQSPYPYATASHQRLTLLQLALTRPVVRGIANFTMLRINTVGSQYSLRFTSSISTKLYVVSHEFPVRVGAPAQLVFLRRAGDAWAGGQPFGRQPILAVQDAGGNTVDTLINQLIQVNLTNPQNGAVLRGNLTTLIVLGMGEFTDLQIDTRGHHYQLTFNTTAGPFSEVDHVDVMYSSEWQVTARDAYPEDQFGYAVALYGDSAAIGVPHDDLAVRDIQVISTVGGNDNLVDEIQIVRTTAVHRHEVQVITSRANPGATVGGTWTLAWRGTTTTLPLPADAYPELLKVHIEYDLGLAAGEVEVSRTPNTACNCNNAYSWSITFLQLTGFVPLVTSDSSSLTGAGAGIDISRYQASTTLDGTFKLSLRNHTTHALPFYASPTLLAFHIQRDLLTGPVSVTRSGPDDELGYIWSVTFKATQQNYDVPQMTANSSLLTGFGAKAEVHTHREGLSPIGGSFQMYFRGNGPSPPIPYNATALEVQRALQALVTIDDVIVTRTGPTETLGYSWTVTFVHVRNITEEGSIRDPLESNLPPLTPVSTVARPYTWHAVGDAFIPGMLTGTGASVHVDYITSGPVNPPWRPETMGREGLSAGAVVLFNRSSEHWWQSGKLVATDADDLDWFGYSVSLYADRLAVSAPTAADPGVLEQQSLQCHATSGTFTVSYDGHTSTAIAWNATAAQFKAALEALPSIHTVSVSVVGGGGQVCSSSSTVTTMITFIFPQIGDFPALGVDDSALASTNGSKVLTLIDNVVRGTRVSSGTDSSDSRSGAVYMFERVNGAFKQQQKLYIPEDVRTPGALFGWSVDMFHDILVVGAPETIIDGINCGAAFIFERYGPADWRYLHYVTSSAPQYFERFGHAVSVHQNTIAVSAVGYNNKTGRVDVFKRTQAGGRFFLDQHIDAPGDLVAQPAPQFGWDIDLNFHALGIGAPEDRDNELIQSGLVYTYDRPAFAYPYKLTQTIRPTPALVFDRVGTRVRIDANIMVVSASAATKGPLDPRNEVQLIRTTASKGARIGHQFFLSFRKTLVDGSWQDIESRPIPANALASTLRAILMEDLRTGPVQVSRFGPNAEGGYRWFVTFLASTDPDRNAVLTPRSELTGSGATLTVTEVIAAAPTLRGHAYVFTRTGLPAQPWKEQGVLSPKSWQPRDQFGAALDLSNGVALIGAPNRDSFHTGDNSGAAFMFDLAILNVKFDSPLYVGSEHDSELPVRIVQCSPSCLVPATPPLYPYLPRQQLVQYSTSNGNDWRPYTFVPYGGEAIDRAPAIGRPDCSIRSNATDDCLWIPSDGDSYRLSTYDFDAVSDFAPHWTELEFNASVNWHSVNIIVTDDTVLEVPDETLHVRLYVPGFNPTFGSDLWSQVEITDDGDGGVGSRSYFEKILPTMDPVQAGAHFGTSVDVCGALAVVGSPDESVGSFKSAGAIYLLSRSMGMWSVEQRIVAPQPSQFGRFGSAVAIDGTYVVVGAPGNVSVSFFRRISAGNWQHERTMTPSLGVGQPPMNVNSRFGIMHAVTMSGLVAVVGAPGEEAAFVFRRLSGVWTQTLVLRAPEYRRITWLTTTHVFPARFGASVDMSGDTLVVGSPAADYGPIPAPTTFSEVEQIPNIVSSRGKGRAYVFVFNASANAAAPTLPGFINYDTWLAWPDGDDMQLLGNTPYFVADGGGGVWAMQTELGASDAKGGDRFGEDVAIDTHQIIVGSYANPAQPNVTWDFETGDLRGWRQTGVAFLTQPTWGDNTLGRSSSTSALGPAPPEPSGLLGRFWVGTYENRSMDSDSVLQPPRMVQGFHQGDEPQGTMTSEPFTIAGNWISFLIGGGCDLEKEFVELLVDGLPTLRATGACKETMERVHWNVDMYIHRAGQIRVVDASSAGWGHINVDDFRFAWPMQEYTETPMAGAAYVFRRKERYVLYGCTHESLRCEWEAQGKLVAGDKRPGAMFGFSVDIDDSTGTAVVGAYSQPDVLQDWAMPGSHVGLSMGPYGLADSKRADGGINNGDIGGYTRSVWSPERNPYLRSVRSSGGGFSNTGYGDWDIAGASGVHGGTGAPGSTGGIYAARGAWSGQNTNELLDGIDVYASMSFVDVDQRGPVAHPLRRVFGGSGPNEPVGAQPAPTGMVYVFHRIPLQLDGLNRILREPLWSVQQHTQLLADTLGQGARYGFDVSIEDFSVMAAAPYDSVLGAGTGSVRMFDVEHQRIRFSQNEYHVKENSLVHEVAIRILREGDLSGSLTVEYTTRDVTAVGVNVSRAESCFLLARHQRNAAGCGDYTQSNGFITFLPTEQYRDIVVNITDDTCHEEEIERFIIQLSLPGGIPLRGEGYMAFIRIDDNDMNQPKCPHPLRPAPERDPCIHLSYQPEVTCDSFTGRLP